MSYFIAKGPPPMKRKSRILRTIITSALALTMTASAAFAAPILKLNSHGHDVTVLQQRLQSLGYNIKSVDGEFGNEVYRAVIAFQRDNKLTINGVVDAKTWNTLKTAKGNPKSNSSTIALRPSSAKPASSNTTAAHAAPAIGSIAPINTKVPEGPLFLDKSKVSSIIASAKKQIGVPYVYGGTTPKGFDCSGFLQYVFAQNGFKIPRLADDQYALGKKTTSRSQLEQGDLVFFATEGKDVSHCGIYLGNNQFIHASSSKGIRIDSLDDVYWKPRYFGGKHIIK